MKILSNILFVLCFAATAANAQNKSHMIGLGPSKVLDTYLTPENFSGTGFTYMYIKEQRDTTRLWSNTYEHEVDLSNTHDRSHNINDLEITYNLYWARYYNFRPVLNGLKLQAGVAANLCAGAIYNMTSSNNPAQARAALNIMPSATATYGFHISRHRFTARYELNLPLVGVMFSPNYGQSYYEIFSRGNYDHNIVPTTFVSAPTFRQLASVDWHCTQKWALRLAYLGNYQQAQVNNLKQHTYTHRILLGITRSL
ncbi:DUF3316 domain-containing protein [Xylanibacter ruminicola]|jgi:hypothetical protein|uniref:DUF3316 domain-containing protein n=1 Tax=Xylanibacter ruminicola TaxID=839 RepID=UPI00055E32F4|nr:DUF3316 domain-containing protein [Xylanibacter ruminicola]